MKSEEIVNRVANSNIITFDLEKYYIEGERVVIDIKDLLFQGQILREKDVREYVSSQNWSSFENKFVALTCSVDAIIPTWAYMLIAIHVSPFAKKVVFGTSEDLEREIFQQKMLEINWTDFANCKVVIKGCSKINVPQSLFVEVVNKLRPIANSIMFGEPCSTVPLFKKAKTQ